MNSRNTNFVFLPQKTQEEQEDKLLCLFVRSDSQYSYVSVANNRGNKKFYKFFFDYFVFFVAKKTSLRFHAFNVTERTACLTQRASSDKPLILPFPFTSSCVVLI